jgi:hypothetical protein
MTVAQVRRLVKRLEARRRVGGGGRAAGARIVSEDDGPHPVETAWPDATTAHPALIPHEPPGNPASTRRSPQRTG